MAKKGLAVGVVLLFLLSSAMSVGIGGITSSIRVSPSEKTMNSSEMNRYSIHRYPEAYFEHDSLDVACDKTMSVQNQGITSSVQTEPGTRGPMDSPWPMYSHDVHHTGRSPYNTTGNPEGVEKWRYNCDEYVQGGPILDQNGTIYFGSFDGHLYAFYPNGTIKWGRGIGTIDSTPAIDEDGMIYIGTIWCMPNYLFALYSNNGTVKWSYYTGDDIDSSPTIGNDGTIYFGDWNGWIHALYPNRTLRWKYHTGNIITGSPAIGQDGTVYCGSHDNKLYAFYPNNGTVKWTFQTGDWVRVSPCISDDGTVYCVSLDNYLYAIYPGNGTMKWRINVGAGTNPTIGKDGTIYAGYSNLYAVRPNGTIKWVFNPGAGRSIRGSTPCTSAEGIIYFGTSDGGEIIAVNPNGTERWRDDYGWYESPPAIGAEGSIYIGCNVGTGTPSGCIRAFGRGPLKTDAGGPYSGLVNTTISFSGTIYGGNPPYTVLWDFGDGDYSTQLNPYHTYALVGNYTASFTATDSEGNQSNDTTTVTITYPLPTVTIIKPIWGIYFMNKRILPFNKPVIIGRITIEAIATQVPLGIDRVEFYVGDTLKATDTTAPYSWTWTGPQPHGTYMIRAFAYDTAQRRSIAIIYVLRII